MHPAKFLAAALLAASAAQAQSVMGPSVLVPASPMPFEAVNLRMRVDSCAFMPGELVVKTVANVIQVHVEDTVACSPAGPPMDVDVRLGAYPAGTYNVESVLNRNAINGREQVVYDRLQFTVAPRTAAGNRFPLADYNGLWWNAQESGWGLSLHQDSRDSLFGALFVYDAQGRAQWFTLQSGAWASSRHWEGKIYRTTGPYFAGASYNPSTVLTQDVGSAVLEFDTAPGGTTTARFTYTVDGVEIAKTITPMAF